jgi:hypoxanthine phosphoribosyltransferase
MKPILTQEQIQKRVRELGRQISNDYRKTPLTAICVLETGFIFMADLVRSMDVPVECQFLKPFYREKAENNIVTTEIFYSPEVQVDGKHVLLVDGILQSGVTAEFLIRTMFSRGAASVKTVVLLDRQAMRRVPLQPDYFGFLIDNTYLVGYGLDAQRIYRNLPYIAALAQENQD